MDIKKNQAVKNKLYGEYNYFDCIDDTIGF